MKGVIKDEVDGGSPSWRPAEWVILGQEEALLSGSRLEKRKLNSVLLTHAVYEGQWRVV